LQRQAGHTFMREGEDSDFVLLIKKGHVKVVVGRPARIIAIRGPEEIIGDMGVVRRKPRSATVIAWDDIEVLHVSDIEWLSFLYEYPRAMHAQLLVADERLEQATSKIVDSDLAVERRLAKALVELVDSGLTTRTDDVLSLNLAQRDLASLTGASIEAIKKVVKAFKENGLIDTGRMALHIKDAGALWEVANGKPTASW
jgi:CRP/FNR family transcriptional regulator, cyclic AMP receptor protein